MQIDNVDDTDALLCVVGYSGPPPPAQMGGMRGQGPAGQQQVHQQKARVGFPPPPPATLVQQGKGIYTLHFLYISPGKFK